MSTATELALAEAELELAQAQSQAIPVEKPEPTAMDIAGDVGKYALKGLGHAAEFLGDVGDYALIHPLSRNFGFDPEIAQKGRTAISDVAAPALERTTTKGENPFVDAALTGTELATSSVLPAGGLSKTKMALEAGIFGAGGAAGSLATDDNQWGSLAGGLLASTRGLGIPKAAMRIKDGIKQIFSNPAQTKEATRIIDEIALDAPAAKALLKTKLAAGEKGTVGQLTGDRGILEMEKTLANKSNSFKGGLDAINEQISKFAMGKIDDVIPQGADIQAPLAAAKSRVSGALSKAKEIGEKAQQRTLNKALTQQSAVGREGALTAATQKSGLEESLTAMSKGGESALKANNIEKLNLAAPQGTVVSKAGQEGITQLSDDISRSYGEAWTGVKTVSGETISSFNKAATKGLNNVVDDVEKATIQTMQRQLDEVSKAPTTEKIKEFDKSLRNRIRSAATGEKLQPELLDSLNAMRDALRKGFPTQVTDKLKALDGKYGSYLALENATAAARKTKGVFTPEQLLEGSNRVGGVGRIAKGTAPLQKEAAAGLGVVKSQADELAATQKMGEQSIKATQAKTADQISDIAAQQQQKAKTLRSSEKLRTTKIQESPTGKFSEYEKSVNAVDDVFKNKKNPAAQTEQLIKTAKKDKTGKSIAGLKAAYIKNFASKIDDHGKMSRDSMKKFDELEDAMRPLFGKGEIKNLREAIRESDKIYKHLGVKPAELPEATKGALFYAATIFGLNAGSKIATNPLMAARLGREISTKFVSKGPHGKIVKAMEELMLNPQQYAKEVAAIRAKPTKKNISFLLNRIPAINAAAKEGDK